MDPGLAEPGRDPADAAERNRTRSRDDDLRVDQHGEVVEPPKTVIADAECDGEREVRREQESKDSRPARGQTEDQQHGGERLTGSLRKGERKPVRRDDGNEQLMQARDRVDPTCGLNQRFHPPDALPLLAREVKPVEAHDDAEKARPDFL